MRRSSKDVPLSALDNSALAGVELKVVKGGSSKWPKRVKWLLQALGDAAWEVKIDGNAQNSIELFSSTFIESDLQSTLKACIASDKTPSHDCEACMWRKTAHTDEWMKIEKRAASALLCLSNPGIPTSHPEQGSLKSKSPSMAISEANFLVGECFSQTLNANRPDGFNLHLIGSHGQTIWHNPSHAQLIPNIDKKGVLKPNNSETIATASSPSSTLPLIPNMGKISSTLQIGEAGVMASRVEGGATVISNFRTRDVAVGGQGAPLTSTLDYVMAKGLLQKMDTTRDGASIVALQNMGGIGNVTILPPSSYSDSHEDGIGAIAFDTGPANVLLDWYVRKEWKGAEYDENGSKAKSGRPSPPHLLMHLLSHPYFALPFPKTCGREVFTAELVESWAEHAFQSQYSFDLQSECMFEASTEIERLHAYEANAEGNTADIQPLAQFKKEDFLRLLTDLSAASIVLSYLRFTPSLFKDPESLSFVPFPSKIFVSGGGSHNSFLLDRIQHFASLAASSMLAPLERHVFGDSKSSEIIEKILRRLGEEAETVFSSTGIEPPLPPSPSVQSHSLTGIDADLKESVLFALLAFLTIHAKPASVPSCTGALSPSILGSITPGNDFLNLMSNLRR